MLHGFPLVSRQSKICPVLIRETFSTYEHSGGLRIRILLHWLFMKHWDSD